MGRFLGDITLVRSAGGVFPPQGDTQIFVRCPRCRLGLGATVHK